MVRRTPPRRRADRFYRPSRDASRRGFGGHPAATDGTMAGHAATSGARRFLRESEKRILNGDAALRTLTWQLDERRWDRRESNSTSLDPRGRFLPATRGIRAASLLLGDAHAQRRGKYSGTAESRTRVQRTPCAEDTTTPRSLAFRRTAVGGLISSFPGSSQTSTRSSSTTSPSSAPGSPAR